MSETWQGFNWSNRADFRAPVPEPSQPAPLAGPPASAFASDDPFDLGIDALLGERAPVRASDSGAVVEVPRGCWTTGQVFAGFAWRNDGQRRVPAQPPAAPTDRVEPTAERNKSAEDDSSVENFFGNFQW